MEGGSLTFNIDKKTQEMLAQLAQAKANLETQQRLIFQVLINQYEIPGDAQIEVSPDFATMTARPMPVPGDPPAVGLQSGEGVPTRPVPDLSTGPLKK